MPVKTSTREAATLVGLKVPFHSYGALSARAFTGNDYLWAPRGQLPVVWHDPFVHDAPLYVVYSYDTPIAWFSPLRGWVVPQRKYSATTSRHQGVTQRGITNQGLDYVTTVAS